MTALFGRSLQNVSIATPAAARELVVARVDLGTAGYDGAGSRRFLNAVTERLAAEPDIVGVAAQSLQVIRYRRSDATGTATAPDLTALVRYVTPSWFEVLGARARAGRVLRADDDTTVAVVNDRLLARLGANGRGVGEVLAIRESDAQPRMGDGRRRDSKRAPPGPSVVLIGSALAAAVLPARRAAHVDPVQT